VIDLVAPSYRETRLASVQDRLSAKASAVRENGLRYLLKWGMSHIRYRTRRMTKRLQRSISTALFGMGLAIPGTWRKTYVYETYFKILSGYRPDPVEGELVLFRSEDVSSLDEDLGWSRLIEGQLRVLDLPVSHLEILKRPESVSKIVSYLKDYARSAGFGDQF
jgi:hypothetical protein